MMFIHRDESDTLSSVRIRTGHFGRPVLQVQYAARVFDHGRMRVEGVMQWRDAKRRDTVAVAQWFDRTGHERGV